MNEIENCYINNDKSFLNKLFYESYFDTKLFDCLCKEIIVAIKENKGFDVQYFKKANFLTNKISLLLISHYDVNDQYEIKNGLSNIRLFWNRWLFLIDCYINGNAAPIGDYEDDLGILP